ncbi:hypothetical protein TVAG_270720 [Trichomonas vaginalis G3]|uniref:Uncharacterized protein n=1 Tax=Trichomonas vaginalis (strain ATCC PRA-98 / G3) TaxID=412133 RepID=A2FIG4_TRIV3|nr:hypothetical protein TVAGG3_0014690 [Trichomonas vaginalis G3]EAX95281.1 hypothetical protein TVAG_270720 [Trichomonas vaginalis G3]KAI5539338.1 hypothetical protein TVAGG3_0014690 [Trichomonas vaginalis G3]|eukprot:XP_001308211.1 hypothetical protein [Trichomonas vaginalis G3]
MIESIYYDSVSKQQYTSAMIIGFAAGGMLILFIVAVIALYLYRKAYSNSSEDEDSDLSSETDIDNISEGRTRVSYEIELEGDQIAHIDDPSDIINGSNDDEAYMNNMDF